jgi:hypothetical protein
MPHGIETIASCFYAEKFDGRVFGEGVEHSDGVASTANACYNGVGEFPTFLEHLLAGFVTDYGLESSHDGGEGVRADG